MSVFNNILYPVRIPALPSGRIVDDKGNPTADELTFRQTLVTLLNQILGNEGLVITSQTTANISTIVANTSTTQGTSNTVYTCLPGTLFYNSTNNTMEVILLTTGVPARYLVTTTAI